MSLTHKSPKGVWDGPSVSRQPSTPPGPGHRGVLKPVCCATGDVHKLLCSWFSGKSAFRGDSDARQEHFAGSQPAVGALVSTVATPAVCRLVRQCVFLPRSGRWALVALRPRAAGLSCCDLLAKVGSGEVPLTCCVAGETEAQGNGDWCLKTCNGCPEVVRFTEEGTAALGGKAVCQPPAGKGLPSTATQEQRPQRTGIDQLVYVGAPLEQQQSCF